MTESEPSDLVFLNGPVATKFDDQDKFENGTDKNDDDDNDDVHNDVFEGDEDGGNESDYPEQVNFKFN